MGRNDVIRHAIGERVTRADLEPLATKEFVRAATFTLLKLFP